jgi:short-subunit dehydrogenase
VTLNVLIVGGSSGVGLSCYNLLAASSEYQATAWSSKDLDLNFPEKIIEKDLSSYDIIINCAAHSQGTYQGFLNNSWENQLSQIMVNYASNLFLFKHYANSKSSGKYVWCSSDFTEGVTPYKGLYLSTKIASQYAFDLIQQEIKHISILEVQFQAVQSNFRYRNFEGTLSHEQIAETYKNIKPLSSDYVAENLIKSINNVGKVKIQ